jgi:nicotinamidase-related amidase
VVDHVRAYPRRFPYTGLVRDRLALIVIDMQRDFLDPAGYLAAMGYELGGVRAAIEPARRLLAAARAAGIRVVHTRNGYPPDLGGLPPHKLARIEAGDSSIGKPGPLGRFLIRGEPGFEIVEELAPRAGETVIDKSGASAFSNTRLADLFDAQGIHALILAGVTTDVCVHSTLRDANDRGFECLLATDACGSGDLAAHRAAIHMVTVENGVFGVVAEVDSVIEALSGTEPG